MKKKELIKKASRLAEPFCITGGKDFRLKQIDPDDTFGFKSENKPKVKEALK